ncbi:50S ribosomal protein L9 [Candidatus Falkowbacteria bacterium]|jgi:large subunit ribosomal protein L9|nr:50S ribosomal protein L9 [Candidatus Falkowbacteria bacterium]MBT7007510.1 50S ribosomal protein L9 [Candidatus Falkowbacteria bacterium]
MKIILLKHDKKLGRKGDVKDVSDGHARNFLIPQKVAAPYSLKMEQKLQQDDIRQKKSKVDPKVLANKIKAITLTFEEKADENGTFFAGISKEKIAKALAAKGITVHPKKIVLDSPIKQATKTTVQINVDSGIKSEIKIITNTST